LEDILLWVGANSGKIPFEPKKLNFVNICNDVIDNLKLSASNKNIFINQILEEQIYVFGDRDMIHTILRNLVSNAIKFTLPNGKIDIYGELDHSYVIITVSDNGTGMEPEVLTKLFDITQKITTEGTAHEKGTGLGLLICKEFVEQHNGQIWVESQLGKGTNFKFSIPLSKN